jgi:hypothetical protein
LSLPFDPVGGGSSADRVRFVGSTMPAARMST